jgi:hypothetical protein
MVQTEDGAPPSPLANPESGFTLRDYAVLYLADVSEHWTNHARSHILPYIEKSSITATTLLRPYGDDEEEWEHLYSALRTMPPETWTLHKESLLYEPSPNAVRYNYQPDHYKPTTVILTIDNRTSQWDIPEDSSAQQYEVGGNGSSGFIPTTRNAEKVGPGARFTIFRHFHEIDEDKEFRVEIFYRKQENQLRLHCVAIPLPLLAKLITKKTEVNGNQRRESEG